MKKIKSPLDRIIKGHFFKFAFENVKNNCANSF